MTSLKAHAELFPSSQFIFLLVVESAVNILDAFNKAGEAAAALNEPHQPKHDSAEDTRQTRLIKEESIRADLAILIARWREATDPDEQEELSDEIEAISMGCQCREIFADDPSS